MRRWRATPKGREWQRRQNLRRQHGLTLEQYETMLGQQSGGCAICGVGNPPTLAVDHNHKTGKIRGLLCAKCNTGLGGFRDDTSLLCRAIAYLKEQP